MKLNFRYLLLIGLIFPFILLSCKTTPPDPAVELAGPVDEVSLEGLAKARAEAEESRSWAEYVNGNTYFPGEWRTAEGRYSEAKGFPEPKTKGEAIGQIEKWVAVSDLYKDIYNRSLRQFAAEQQKMLDAAREDAVKAGAEILIPDRLAVADELADKSKKLYAGGLPSSSVVTGRKAVDSYKVLETIALARAKQEEADLNNFYSRDPDNYLLAAEAGNAAVDFYDEKKLPEAQAAANESLARFNQVIKNGWASQVEEKASIARERRAAALEVKANVAVKQDFDGAERIYNNAQASLRAEEYAIAVELFDQSIGLFNKAHENALAGRRIAEEALRAAEQKLAESEQKAQAADEYMGGE